MNKSELIDAMAAGAGISKAAAKKALEAMVGGVSSTLKGGGRVSLVGFGSSIPIVLLPGIVDILARPCSRFRDHLFSIC